MSENKDTKSKHAEREERILSFWKEKGIFEKSLKKNEGKGKNFIFYEGPPTANGHPGIHHLEARSFKDAIPRYKTMQGFYVRRKGGWDTHGLPVELQVEKELGLKSKKEIEQYGVDAFNEKCKESVWKYVHEWEDFTERMGYWVDLKDPYITYKPQYIESIWNIISKIDEQDLLYKDYKVVPWCPRCGTGLSSHELAQGYQDVKDLSVYVKFKVKNPEKIGLKGDVFLLAWTTTPWTLPGNVGLAVGEKVEYVGVKVKGKSQNAEVIGGGEEVLILAKERLAKLGKGELEQSGKNWLGKDLVGLEYEPLYPFLLDNISGSEKEKVKNAYKVYPADFVTTVDGTGIVHIAPMYGQDDFELGTKVGLPKYHLVNDDGTFKKEAISLAGLFVKDQNTDVTIIKDLAGRDLLFAKEKYEHNYPHCWRCKTPLIYFARDSWYVKMSALRDKLVKENEGINWEPEYIKEGRFGEWLREIKDWAISRERYWGTPLPIWICDDPKCGKRKVIGAVSDLTNKQNNSYTLIRHGEAENNVADILSGIADVPHHLTEKGKKQVADAIQDLANIKFDLAFVSPFIRTRETFDILNEKLGLRKDQVIFDDRIGELQTGVWNGKKVSDFVKEFTHNERFERGPEGGENYADVKKRVGEFLFELETKYKGKNILIVSHETPIYLMFCAAKGLDRKQSLLIRGFNVFIENAKTIDLKFDVLPHNSEYELDLHKPHIDEVVLDCECGGKMKRVKEVMDVWFDSGSMPFAQDHYPFENRDSIEQQNAYPADFISEAIDQTRGWFYTLHAIGVLLGKGKAYKNVICLGHLLDKNGKKMSKSLGNIVDPWDIMNKYGADAARLWMYSVNQPGESKNFDEKTVDEIVKKVFNLTSNVLSFYKMYEHDSSGTDKTKDIILVESKNILDKWIIARLTELNIEVTKSLDAYKFFEPSRAIRDFIADLSQWYLRRSRDRFKTEGEEKEQALNTIRYVLITLAKMMAPLTPFFAEELYRELGGNAESVHLENWPMMGNPDLKVIEIMKTVREVCSKGLEARMTAKVNVRQPLAELRIKEKLSIKDYDDALEIIKDEVNVKRIVFDETISNEVELDLNITPQLKEEGMVRELIRLIQDLRKEKGLTVNDKAVLKIDTDKDGESFVEKNKTYISSVAQLSDIQYSKLESEFMDVSGLKIKISI
jgi:isoleucyl-tRNA synthetase